MFSINRKKIIKLFIQTNKTITEFLKENLKKELRRKTGGWLRKKFRSRIS